MSVSFKDQLSSAAPAAVTISILSEAIRSTQARTVMGLQSELITLTDTLVRENPRYRVAIRSGSELFMRFITRSRDDVPDFDKFKTLLMERGNSVMMGAEQARAKVSVLAQTFVKDGCTILVHSYSRAVVRTLILAATQHKKLFNVIATESLPDRSGLEVVRRLKEEANIPVRLIRDCAIGFVMESVDMVMVGAEGVVESGGIINKVGTYAVSLVAKQCSKPFYVIAESFKFTRLYPLSQADVAVDVDPKAEEPIYENIPVDYTPPTNITLLCTDLGVFTPSAVSDELMKTFSLT